MSSVTRWQIRYSRRMLEGDTIIFEGTEEAARHKWNDGGYKTADAEGLPPTFGLVKVTYEVIEGGVEYERGNIETAQGTMPSPYF